MITAGDFYKVMCAMVPLYFAMFIAYASVKWWKIFSPEQCSGVNRFVSFFAVPVLSFHFISQNNPYEMDTKFILADTLSKLFVLAVLSVVAAVWGGLDWLITLFSVATLPNTLVMGIPLLKSMYGDFTESLMVQLVVLQCIIWYTLLLFLFEYRAARVLIRTQFPGHAAASITQIEVDNDVVSLDGRDPLRTESDTDGYGRIRLRIRRSISSFTDSAVSSSMVLTPRASNLSNAEIFSINTPGPLHNYHNDIVLCSADAAGGFGYCRAASPRLSGYTSSDVYSLQPTPRASNFNEMDVPTAGSTPIWIRSPVGGKIFQPSPTVPSVMVAWDGQCGGGETTACKEVGAGKEASFRDCARVGATEGGDQANEAGAGGSHGKQAMPGAMVMLKLILVVVGRKLSRNPNTYSSILGLLWSLVSFRWNVGMPSLIKYSIKIISDAGLGMAMFSLGLFMALQPRIIACGTKKAVISMGIRFLFGPLVMSVASIVMRLKGVKLHAAIVQAALPQGIVPFVFAREYGLHPDILSTGVIFGMLVSLPVTLLYYILLGLKW